ncbi:stromelysin-1-like [Pecten maximus]|uniref:stromelysin-1-like n=1 Tax=Pecten maximus TaxID=6579 RepID=UPI0014589348|nr:stromelysin-1-like [Pecten maximus]
MWTELHPTLVIVCVIVSLANGHSLYANRDKRQAVDVSPVEYLRHYGYLRDEHYTSQVPADPAELAEAFKIYQNYLKLEITGSINSETQHAMNRPRCGCNDVFSIWMNTTTRDRVKRFAQYRPVNFNARRGWRTTNLTWQLLGTTRARIPRAVVRSEIIRAFALWSAETPLRFSEVNQGADIDIDFAIGAHGDGSPFDGPSGVLAHAFFPELGTTHFDDREQWTTNSTTGAGIDLFIVAAHEFGHALGLDHSNVRNALMFPTYLGFIPNFKLSTDDIRGIRSIYGGPPSRSTTPPPTRPTTLRPTRPRTTRPTTTVTTTRPTRPPTTRPTRPTTRRPRTTIRPSLHPECGRTYNAVFEDDNGDLLMFRSYYLFQVPVYDPDTDDLRGSRASNMFPGVMSFPDAVFHVPGSTYVIRRTRMQKFSRPANRLLGERVLEVDTWRALRGLGRRSRITAAVALTQNDVLVFGRNRGRGVVWEFDVFSGRLVQGSMALMSTRFPGIPEIVDMAFSRDPSEITFIVRGLYYNFDLVTFDVFGPLEFAPDFIGGRCVG